MHYDLYRYWPPSCPVLRGLVESERLWKALLVKAGGRRHLDAMHAAGGYTAKVLGAAREVLGWPRPEEGQEWLEPTDATVAWVVQDFLNWVRPALPPAPAAPGEAA